jgi:hypothetical protein
VADINNKSWIVHWPVTAWCDALAAIEQMPWVFGTALLGIVVLDGLDALVLPHGLATGLGARVLPLVVGAVQALLLTPAAIAVHRFIILQERTSHYRLDLTDRRTSSFFFCAVAVQALITVPFLLFELARTGLGLSVMSIATFPTVIMVVWALVTLRTLILFPAIAVQAPGVGWSNTLLDTKGHILRILLLVVVTAIPAFAVGLLWLVWLGRAIPSGVAGKAILIVFSGVETTVVMAVYAALASRIFLALANRLADQTAVPGQG